MLKWLYVNDWDEKMKLGSKIIIAGFILLAVGVVVIEGNAQSLSHEPRKLSDVPLWIRIVDELVHWHNHAKPHMSPDWENLETPAKAFVRKMPEKGSTVSY